MGKKQDNSGEKIWDEIFKRIVQEMPDQLLPLIEDVFGVKYPRGIQITKLATEHVIPAMNPKHLTSIYSDVAVKIGEDIYHFEFQMTNERNMTIRMFKYDINIAFANSIVEFKDGSASIDFPKSVVIYPAVNEKIPDEFKNIDELNKYDAKILDDKDLLNQKIEEIKNQKSIQENKLNGLLGELKSAKSNFLEIQNKAANSKKDLDEKLKSAGLSMKNFLKFLAEIEDIKKEVARDEKILKEIEIKTTELKILEKDLNISKPELIENAKKIKSQMELQKQKFHTQEKNFINRLVINKNCLSELNKNYDEIQKLEQQYKIAKIMSEVAKGGRKRIGFEKYVLSACVNEVLTFANIWLCKITSGRYSFSKINQINSQDLELNIFDTFSGKTRNVTTLSGGETFAASLSLSLGLCDVISSRPGGVELGTMLIDEGFGTLDSEYLNSVIQSLSTLQKSGRIIGLISHIPELKGQIRSQIQITQNNSGGGSKITVVR